MMMMMIIVIIEIDVMQQVSPSVLFVLSLSLSAFFDQ